MVKLTGFMGPFSHAFTTTGVIDFLLIFNTILYHLSKVSVVISLVTNQLQSLGRDCVTSLDDVTYWDIVI